MMDTVKQSFTTTLSPYRQFLIPYTGTVKTTYTVFHLPYWGHEHMTWQRQPACWEWQSEKTERAWVLHIAQLTRLSIAQLTRLSITLLPDLSKGKKIKFLCKTLSGCSVPCSHKYPKWYTCLSLITFTFLILRFSAMEKENMEIGLCRWSSWSTQILVSTPICGEWHRKKVFPISISNSWTLDGRPTIQLNSYTISG